jgi:hypothetical protein
MRCGASCATLESLSVPWAALHPVWLLPFALIGLIAGPPVVRRLLVVALPVTAIPAVFGKHSGISTHTLLPLFPVLSLAMAHGFDRTLAILRVKGAPNALVTVGLGSAILWWSVSLYFSPASWAPAVVGTLFSFCRARGLTTFDVCPWARP